MNAKSSDGSASGHKKRPPRLTFPDVVESLRCFYERPEQADGEADIVLFDKPAQFGQRRLIRSEEGPRVMLGAFGQRAPATLLVNEGPQTPRTQPSSSKFRSIGCTVVA